VEPQLAFKNVSLGVAGVLFAGLIWGYVQPAVKPPEVFATFGLAMFVYAIGLSSSDFLIDAWSDVHYKNSILGVPLMQKNARFYMFLIAALMTAGCATKEAVVKDGESASAPSVSQTGSQKPTESDPATLQATKVAAPVVAQAETSSAASIQKASEDNQQKSNLKSIYFDFDSSGLTESARTALSHNAEALTKETASKIRIEGNCDERGSAEYNLALGERRAKAVHQYLVTLGVKPVRLSTISYGNEKPASMGSDEAAWAKNRRAEFAVLSP
jgi:peptidoglycan-associated lipoprotein